MLEPRRAHILTWHQRAPTEVGCGLCGWSQTPPLPTATNRGQGAAARSLSRDSLATALFTLLAWSLDAPESGARGHRGPEGTERHEGPSVATSVTCEGGQKGPGPAGRGDQREVTGNGCHVTKGEKRGEGWGYEETGERGDKAPLPSAQDGPGEGEGPPVEKGSQQTRCHGDQSAAPQFPWGGKGLPPHLSQNSDGIRRCGG